MTQNFKSLAIVAFTVATAQAATITLDTAAFIDDSEGNPITKGSGIVSIGTYNAFPALGVMPTNSQVIDPYQELGFGAFDTTFELDGFFRFSLDVTIPNLSLIHI